VTYQRGDVKDKVERGLDPAVMRPAESYPNVSREDWKAITEVDPYDQ